MAAGERTGVRGLARLLEALLREHRVLEVKGLGEFRSSEAGELCFGGERRPVVFISYASEDRRAAEKVSARLEAAGFSPWVDRRRLKPGDAWQRRIESAVASADYFLACLSRRSLKKRGTFQRELRMAMDVARNMPLDETYFIPLRLDECAVPAAIRNEWQYIDLFPDFEGGIDRVVAALRRRN